MTLPKVGDEGIARWRGYTFRAKVLCIVTARTGPSLSVAATGRAAWHSLPAASVCVAPADFRPMPRLHTHEDLRRAGVENHDEGRACGLCGCDVPSGYKNEHGQGVCVQAFNGAPAGRSAAATDTTVLDALTSFRLSLPPCPNCGQRHAVGSHGCTDGG